jgi:1-acyl-sn-glycerol-3-phosphate acyltransferase
MWDFGGVHHSWKIVQYGLYPLNTFTAMSLEVLEPIERGSLSIDELIFAVENSIKKAFGQV